MTIPWPTTRFAVTLGGKRSRGLGVAELTSLQVSALELWQEGVKEIEVSDAERKSRLRNYLVDKEFRSRMELLRDGYDKECFRRELLDHQRLVLQKR